uniref:CSON004465 protein n=1 Tax=Culicoides sonorensis TaxID=179676 RepID=A0A336LTF6_CULSO
MSENQNSLNSNELEDNVGQMPSSIRKESADITRGTVGQSESNSTTTTNNQNIIVNGNNDTTQNPEGVIRQREENPFSFKHFLKRDPSNSNNNPGAVISSSSSSSLQGSSMTLTTSVTTNPISTSASQNSTNNICHSRSTSIINGTDSHAPSKSATTSSLNQNQHTGARPKIPQFQSVHALGTGGESKMKRSPRFPSFDSQSSLSELSDERSNLFHSRSNSSFNSDYPVQRSFSNYDIESPVTSGSPKYDRKINSTQNQSPSHPHHNYTGRNSMEQPRITNNRHINTSEFSAALPDFVQDHLVMEQWYHGLSNSPKSTSPVSVDFEHLPDFTINNLDAVPDLGTNRSNIAYVDLSNDLPPLELNVGSNRNSNSRTPPRNARNPSPIIPLDLPRQNNDVRREQAPPDLPPDITEGQRGAFGYGGHSDMNRDQSTDKIQTLPDFLSDGPIHSSGRLADVTHDTPHFNSPDENPVNTTIARLQAENDRLRNELDDCRQIIMNQTCRISELEHLLIEERRSSNRINDSLASSNNSQKLEDSSLICRLKQQVKQMSSEMEKLRKENETLKREEGAVGGASGGSSAIRGPRSSQLSRELRMAAASAENNLRQLLSGVENLRLMAANIETMDRLNDPLDEFLSDDDEDEDRFKGPAL